MTYWEGLVLGVVQGFTEFLPISSSGHLVVAETALGLGTPGVVLEVVLHVATLLAVIVVYRRRLAALIVGAFGGERAAWRSIGLLAVGSVPAAVAGLWLAELFERTFESLALVGVNFVLTGAVLWSTRSLPGAPEGAEPDLRGAGAIGVGQALAILPGISRSGTTIAVALWLRVTPERAAEFSFLLAIPAIAGAAALQIPDLSAGLNAIGTGPLVVSFLASLAAGIAAIRLLVALLRTGGFYRFAPYLWMLGIGTITWAVLQ